MQVPQIKMTAPAHGESSQHGRTSSQAGVPTHAPEGISNEGLPEVGLQDTAGSELDDPEGSMCPSPSPSRATTIPDEFDDGAAFGIDQVSGHPAEFMLILRRCMALVIFSWVASNLC